MPADATSLSASINQLNMKLLEELKGRGFYVQAIGYEDEIHYLIISCRDPKEFANGDALALSTPLS